MENREQKFQSDHISKMELVSVEPLAQQFQAIININNVELRSVFDNYWDKNHELIVRNSNVKIRKDKNGRYNFKKAKSILENTIGYNGLYKEEIAKIFIKKIEDFNNEKGCILLLKYTKLENFDVEEEFSTIIGMFYYKPEIELIEDIVFELNKPSIISWDESFRNRIESIKRKYRTFEECGDDEVIKSGMNVLMDIIATSNGKPRDDLSVRLQYLEVDNIEIQSFKEELYNRKKGEMFEVNYIIDEDDKESIEVRAQVKIHNIQRIVNPVINDEFIKREFKEFESFEEFKESDKKKYQDYKNSILGSYVMNHIISEITTKSKIPPAPMEWIKNAYDQKLNSMIKMNKSKENVMKLMGISDETQLINTICSEEYNEYVKDLSIRKYCKMYGIDPYNSDEIIKDALNRIKWLDSPKKED